jgi:hypothetical protein
MYPVIIIYPDFLIEDRYVFVSNRFLKDLYCLTRGSITKTEIVNIEYEKGSGIPKFILIADSDDLEIFFDKWHVEFMATYIRSYFG